MPITKLTPENNTPYLEDRLKALEQAVPEAFADGKINWDTLREVLGEDLEEGGCEEYFGLNWPGKREARKKASIPSRGTLVPVPGEGVNEDETENLFIEGDNLEVLKLLQKSYAGKIKMIYIDPPYNTGNDFIYNDDFTDPLEAYLEYTGAKGEGGELLTTNTRADGRFHSKWLSMMYPRLILAKQLLSDDGAIFASIDDNEVHNLRHVMTEVFGPENFVSEIVWKKKTGSGSQIEKVFSEHEYVLVYAKNKNIYYRWRIFNEEDGNFKNPDCDPNGPWESCAITAPSKNRNPNQLYQIEVFFNQPNITLENSPDIIDVFNYDENKIVFRNVPNDVDLDSEYSEKENYARFVRRWSYIPGSMKEIFNQGKVYLNNGNLPRFKKYNKDYEGKALRSIYSSEFSTQQGSSELSSLFGQSLVEYPKPIGLIKTFINATTEEHDIILDFFAGSCTTAHATLLSNVEEGNHCKFIVIQLPERTEPDSLAYESGFKNIAEIGKERIKRAIKRIDDNSEDIIDQTTLFNNLGNNYDLGFKVFSFARSNYKHWKPKTEEDIDSVATLFDDISDPLIDRWKKEDLISEILLLEGFPLTSKLIYLDEISQNEVYQASAPVFCEHHLYICLDDAIQPNTIELLEMEKDDIFICLDSALTDELKARVQDRFNVHVI